METELFLADSSVWLMTMGRLRIPAITDRLRALIEQNRLATTSMVRLELLIGARTKVEFEEIEDQLGGLHLLPIEEPQWTEAATMAFQLRRKGRTLNQGDILIAAVARLAGATLLHTDHHFDLIAEQVSGLNTESLVHLIRKDQ